jgi:hypothetical protein
MSEPTPVIQLGTYTFDKFNVLDPNIYSNSAENISAFSNGMAAVADLNSKTNPIVHKIKKAQVGETIIININIINILVNFDLSKINFIDDLNAVPLFLTVLPSIAGDNTKSMSVSYISPAVVNAEKVGIAIFNETQGTLSLSVASMPLNYKYTNSSKVKTLGISYNATTALNERGFTGTAYTKGTSEKDKRKICATAGYAIDPDSFIYSIALEDYTG